MIKAEVIAASKCQTKIVTLKVVMPRCILAEAKTHRILSDTDEGTEILVIPGGGINDDNNLSKNSASSRAIPYNKVLNSVMTNPFFPIAWQKDHKGMQGTEYWKEEIFIGKDHNMKQVDVLNNQWDCLKRQAVLESSLLHNMGATKQIANRALEPYMYHTVLITATELENFFNLRCPHYVGYNQTENENTVEYTAKSWKEFCAKQTNPAIRVQLENYSTLNKLSVNRGQADIHMMALAEAMYDAYNEADFKELAPGEWHLPFGDQIDDSQLAKELLNFADKKGAFIYAVRDLENLVKQAKIEIAIARCARLSYQTLGDNPVIDYIADIKLYNILKQSGHWSPFEHIARAMDGQEWNECVKTIIDKKGKFVNEYGWLANFRGWIQQRSLLENLI